MTESQQGEVCILSLVGRVDSSNSESVMVRLKGIISSGAKTILVDLASVKYLTSAAFRVLLVTNRNLTESNGRLILCGMAGHVRELFEMGGLLQIFTTYASREEALSKLT